ncbi:hypothetical protein LUZ60_012371 [Juncus effusus]|nr:hypothetical protein LUZ60_012371 [Juncus effusus]
MDPHPHPWRSAPPPPPPPFAGGAPPPHFPPPSYAYHPPPPPPPLASYPPPPPVDYSDVREGSRKRMRFHEDPFHPYGSTNRSVYASKDHGQETDFQFSNHPQSYQNHQENDFQFPNPQSYQNHPMRPIQPTLYNTHNNPYNNSYNNAYPISQNFNQSYRLPSPNYTTSVHMDPNPYLGYSVPNRVDDGFAYRPDTVRSVPVPPPAFNAHGELAGFGLVPNLSHLTHREGQESKYPSVSKPSKNVDSVRKVKINACNLLKEPHRKSRPDNFVIILRGLPGSGKSYLAKMLRDIEIENGGDPPRIHSMDDYFMIEVEKDVEESEGLSSKSRGKKLTKKVVEYCYEAEMEETYRESMLKAFKKTLDEGKFTFVIVDDRNLRVADFAQFWAISKRAGYEVYLLEAPYKDPMGCVARNVHGFKLDEIKKMEARWEEAPPLYLQLDIQPLLRGDDLKEENIKEVDMDLEDDEIIQPTNHVSNNNTNNYTYSNIDNNIHEQPKSQDIVTDTDERYEVKDIGQSKWSKNTEEERENPDYSKRSSVSLSRPTQTYKSSGKLKSVRWGDKADKSGFSIGSSSKNRTNLSLIIGPGSGYSLKSNPLIEEQSKSSKSNNNSETKRLLRAESESFKAVFERRHRIESQ